MEDLKRTAFDPSAKLGDLYDIRTDTLLKSSALRNDIPLACVKVSDGPGPACDTQVYLSETMSEKFSLLRIQRDECLTVLSNLAATTSGANAFLNVCGLSSKDWISACLLYSIQSKYESIDLFSDSFQLSDVCLDRIMTSNATHVIVGIHRGGRAVLSAACKTGDPGGQKEGYLFTMLHQLDAALKGQLVDPVFGKIDELSLNVYSDLSPEEVKCHTPEEALIYLKSLPDLIQWTPGGNGVPIQYTLAPIPMLLTRFGLDDATDRSFRLVEDDRVHAYTKLLEKMSVLKQMLSESDKKATISILKIPPDINDDISLFRSKYSQYFGLEKHLQKTLKAFLIEYRSGRDCDSLWKFLESETTRLESALVHCETISQRISSVVDNEFALFVKEMVSKKNGILFQNDSVNDLASLIYESGDVYVFYASKDFVRSRLWKERSALFSELLVSKRDEKVLFVIVNCEICVAVSAHLQIRECTIQYFKDKQCVNANVTDVRWTPTKVLSYGKSCHQPLQTDPKCEVVLRISCPGSKKHCPDTVHTWTCANCLQIIKYGFDYLLYCACGAFPVESYSFLCNHPFHGSDYFHYETAAWCSFARSLPEPEAISVLVLGETGVGKSTWINALLNYHTYPSLEVALRSQKPIYFVPTRFSVTDKLYKAQNVSIGEDSNEYYAPGQSATQYPRIYRLPCSEGKIIQLIDTPGIGDTKGIQQDQKNLDAIMACVSTLKNLGGICILLHPNSARLSSSFKFCLKELLTRIPVDVTPSLMFCFTNTRGTFYKPGETFNILKQFLLQNMMYRIYLNDDNVYCVDSEAFRCLVTALNGIHLNVENVKDFTGSWEHSSREMKRLLQYIQTLPSFSVAEIVRLNEAKSWLHQLSVIMAKLSRKDRTTQSILDTQLDQLYRIENERNQLEFQLYDMHTDLEYHSLPYRRTVCTSCYSNADSIIIRGQRKHRFSRACCDPCHHARPKVEVVGDVALQKCHAMTLSGMRCRSCNCLWSVHMHIAYMTTEIMVPVINPSVEGQLRKKEWEIAGLQNRIKVLENDLKVVRDGSKEIADVSSHFAEIVKGNAVALYNDAFDEYVQKERNSIRGDHHREEELDKLLEAHQQEIKILESVRAHNDQHSLVVINKKLVQLQSNKDLQPFFPDMSKDVSYNEYFEKPKVPLDNFFYNHFIRPAFVYSFLCLVVYCVLASESLALGESFTRLYLFCYITIMCHFLYTFMKKFVNSEDIYLYKIYCTVSSVTFAFFVYSFAICTVGCAAILTGTVIMYPMHCMYVGFLVYLCLKYDLFFLEYCNQIIAHMIQFLTVPVCLSLTVSFFSVSGSGTVVNCLLPAVIVNNFLQMQSSLISHIVCMFLFGMLALIFMGVLYFQFLNAIICVVTCVVFMNIKNQARLNIWHNANNLFIHFWKMFLMPAGIVLILEVCYRIKLYA